MHNHPPPALHIAHPMFCTLNFDLSGPLALSY